MVYNDKRLQGDISSTCGQYCIYFLLHICRGYCLREITKAFDGFEDNDEAVTDFVNERYNVNTETLDPDYLLEQISVALDKHFAELSPY